MLLTPFTTRVQYRSESERSNLNFIAQLTNLPFLEGTIHFSDCLYILEVHLANIELAATEAKFCAQCGTSFSASWRLLDPSQTGKTEKAEKPSKAECASSSASESQKYVCERCLRHTERKQLRVECMQKTKLLLSQHAKDEAELDSKFAPLIANAPHVAPSAAPSLGALQNAAAAVAAGYRSNVTVSIGTNLNMGAQGNLGNALAQTHVGHVGYSTQQTRSAPLQHQQQQQHVAANTNQGARAGAAAGSHFVGGQGRQTAPQGHFQSAGGGAGSGTGATAKGASNVNVNVNINKGGRGASATSASSVMRAGTAGGQHLSTSAAGSVGSLGSFGLGGQGGGQGQGSGFQSMNTQQIAALAAQFLQQQSHQQNPLSSLLSPTLNVNAGAFNLPGLPGLSNLPPGMNIAAMLSALQNQGARSAGPSASPHSGHSGLAGLQGLSLASPLSIDSLLRAAMPGSGQRGSIGSSGPSASNAANSGQSLLSQLSGQLAQLGQLGRLGGLGVTANQIGQIGQLGGVDMERLLDAFRQSQSSAVQSSRAPSGHSGHATSTQQSHSWKK